jgi:uncharacterized protein
LQIELINAAKEGHLEEMRKALAEGANPEGSVYESYPPLHTAAANGQGAAVRLLLDRGARQSCDGFRKNSSLNLAAAHGHTDVITILLERGADVCYRSLAGTARDLSCHRNQRADSIGPNEYN